MREKGARERERAGATGSGEAAADGRFVVEEAVVVAAGGKESGT